MLKLPRHGPHLLVHETADKVDDRLLGVIRICHIAAFRCRADQRIEPAAGSPLR